MAATVDFRSTYVGTLTDHLYQQHFHSTAILRSTNVIIESHCSYGSAIISQCEIVGIFIELSLTTQSA